MEQLCFLPETIAQVGQNLAGDGGTLEGLEQALTGLRAALEQAWQGAAADQFLRRLEQTAEDTRRSAAQLKELGGQLETVSGIYRAGEAQAQSAQEGLPVDGIFQV